MSYLPVVLVLVMMNTIVIMMMMSKGSLAMDQAMGVGSSLSVG